ncbi:hypothetical protein EHP00_853 [Ecytonucleospora hepatopenaei]|uniref:Uncharacterized protein n=1 Tax=Ecytonucleospora hepatopenaei TaxID=646526 RepID=A0A1W0E4Q0_9MICR|nr:hypothetical protein EHP00_853 [Ecytonucleospora hepatopenaei]
MPKTLKTEAFVCLSTSNDSVKINHIKEEEILAICSSNKDTFCQDFKTCKEKTLKNEVVLDKIPEINDIDNKSGDKSIKKNETVKVDDFVLKTLKNIHKKSNTTAIQNDIDTSIKTEIVEAPKNYFFFDEKQLKRYNSIYENKKSKIEIEKSGVIIKEKDFTHENLEKRLGVLKSQKLPMSQKNDETFKKEDTIDITKRVKLISENFKKEESIIKKRGRPKKFPQEENPPQKKEKPENKTKPCPIENARRKYKKVEIEKKQTAIKESPSKTGKYRCLVQGEEYEKIFFLDDDDKIESLYASVFEPNQHGKLYYEGVLLLRSLSAKECGLFEGTNLIEIEEGKVARQQDVFLIKINKIDGTCTELKMNANEKISEYIKIDRCYVKNGVFIDPDMKVESILMDGEVIDEIDCDLVN